MPGRGENNTNSGQNNQLDSVDILQVDSSALTEGIEEQNENILPGIFPEHLKKYLTARQVDSFEYAARQYQNIRSSRDLADFYLNSLPPIFDIIRNGIQKSHPDIIFAGDDTPVKEWNVFQTYMPYIRVECLCSECSTEPLINLKPLYEKAMETPETDDDRYFKLAVEMYSADAENDSVIYEQGGNINTWFTMDGGDFSSYSNLGNGNIIKLLKLSEKSLESGKIFEEKTLNCRNFFMPVNNMHYGSSKKEVLAEIEKILKECKLNEDERKQVQEAKSNILSNSQVQFNCRNGKCKYEY
jgi:hypothetical protein